MWVAKLQQGRWAWIGRDGKGGGRGVEPLPPPGTTTASKVCVLNFTSRASPYNLGAWFGLGNSGGPAIESSTIGYRESWYLHMHAMFRDPQEYWGTYINVRSATLDTWVPEQVAYIQSMSVVEDRLWNIVRANSLDFNAWTTLIEETESVAEVH
ncbi:hypothetical protein EV1_031996 [Malus domestica]